MHHVKKPQKEDKKEPKRQNSNQKQSNNRRNNKMIDFVVVQTRNTRTTVHSTMKSLRMLELTGSILNKIVGISVKIYVHFQKWKTNFIDQLLNLDPTSVNISL